MKIRRHSKGYNFIGDTVSGTTFRWGRTFEENPKYAPWPELADISISNHCTKGCDFCYRDSKANSSFMQLDDYEYIMKQLNHQEWGNVFQVALGGGEPLEHPDFMKIIDVTLKYGVVPNFTTNGIHLTNDLITRLKKKVGAVALSTIDINNIDRSLTQNLKINNIKCNIHYVLNNLNIVQAIDILNGGYNSHLQDTNSIIFLTYKPIGRADNFRNLELNRNFLNFIKLVDINQCATRIGVDACFVPMLMHYTSVGLKYIDPCECAFFSVYVDENLVMSPCSFSNNTDYSYSLKKYSAEHIWTTLFQNYRESLINKCDRECKSKVECRGRCPYFEGITLCYMMGSQAERTYAN